MKLLHTPELIKVGDVIRVKDSSENSYVKVQFIENINFGNKQYWGHWCGSKTKALNDKKTNMSFTDYKDDGFNVGVFGSNNIKRYGFCFIKRAKITNWRSEFQ